MKIFNQSPYFDDYDENKKFYSMLFRPSYPVQARELTQMQSIIQAQIERLGNHQFKEGAKVLDGQLSFDTKIRYVKLQDTETDVTKFIGATAYGEESGAKAVIVTAVNTEGDEPATLFVKFQASGKNTQTQEFKSGEKITAEGLTTYVNKAKDAVGAGSIAQIERGVYYTLGYFVLVDAQTIVLDKYSDVPTYRVGLEISENIITPENDESLLDNAFGSYNYSAPGAHRYQIVAKLIKTSIDTDVTTNFIDLGQIIEGEIVKIVNTTEYSELEKTLARRTYDESGDYTVRPFKMSIREHRSNDRGQWKPNTYYIRGDVVKNEGRSYVARTTGFSNSANTPPTHTWGTMYENNKHQGIKWEFTKTPKLNNGVFNAEGKITEIEVTNGGRGYKTNPTVEIFGGGGEGAVGKAVVSNGKVVKIMVLDGGHGYTSDDITVSIRGDGEGAIGVAHANFGRPEKFAIGLESGKAYVRGYEIEKVGTSYIAVDKAREVKEVEDVYVNASVGNFVYVTNLHGMPPFATMGKIGIYDKLTESRHGHTNGKKIGECRVRGIEWDSGNKHSRNGVYKLYIFDLSLEEGMSFSENVKSFGDGKNFTADVSPMFNQISGYVNVSNTNVVGVGTSFTTECSVGDYLLINGSFARVEKINNQNSLTIDRSVTASGVSVFKLYTTIKEPQDVSALYRLPNNIIKTVDDKETIYQTMMYTSAQATTAIGHTCTVTFSVTNATFASEDENDNYILICKEDGEIVEPLDISDAGSTSISFTLDEKYQSKAIEAMCTVRKSASANTRRNKKVVNKIKTFDAQDVCQNKYISLGVADVFRLVSVRMSTSKNWDELPDESDVLVDITDRYDLLDGQTENFYGISKIALKGSYNPPSHPIIVEFEYFDHMEGDYFTVDSYPPEIEYGEIPSFNGVSLRDCLDFRPLMLESGELKSPKTIKRGTGIVTAYSYYLGRKDKLALDFQGNFVDVAGIPSSNPQLPETPNLSMNMYNLTFTPYTFSEKDIKVETVDNRRYTMRDIGKLEKRISNLEDYTTLSLLEQQTSNMTITDGDGYDRFKQGFVVDNFKDTTVINTTDASTNVALDVVNGEVRPPFVKKNISLTEEISSIYDRANQHYKAYGKVFTLALDKVEPHVEIISQPFASRTENVNPFAVATFLGTVIVNPSTDDWFEETRLPDVINNVEGDYNDLKKKEGIVWNDWQTTWTGQPTSQSTSRTWYTGQRGWNEYRHTQTTTHHAQQHGESRSGIKTSVTSRIDYEEVGDRVVSTSTIPFMRSRYLLVKVKGLKPYTRFYPFFDDADIDYWCTPASRIEYIPTSTKSFDCTTMAVERGERARVIESTKNSLWSEPTEKTCLDVGDIITSQTCTAVVVGKTVDYGGDIQNPNPKHYLYVVNIKTRDGETIDGRYFENGEYRPDVRSYSFKKDEEIVGSISGATGKIVFAEENKNHRFDPIVTNQLGETEFLFWIPDESKMDYGTISDENATAKLQFRTGERILTVTDSKNNVSDMSYSSADGTYSAIGILNTRQKTINAVRNGKIVTEHISENRTITNTWDTTDTSRKYLDPLAQTFLVDVKGGCFLSKVDVFFASKDDSLPVTLQIRTVENGYPSGKVLAFGEVTLTPSQVKLSKEKVNYVDEHGNTVIENGYDVPTTFEFESPVFVEDGEEYAIVILSNSVKYRVWIAEVGGKVPNKEIVISKQPYNGVLFKSQNASTWTANQNQDLKFSIYRANFERDEIANLRLVNNLPTPRYLRKDPFQTAVNSGKIRVMQENHGFMNGDYVSFTHDNPNEIDDLVQSLSGTITVTKKSNKVRGKNTKFKTELKIGYALYVDNAFVGVVKSIEDDSGATLYESVFNEVLDKNATLKETVNGIPTDVLFDKTYQVSNVDLHSYVITLDGATAFISGYSGGNNIKATQNYQYDILQPSINAQSFSETMVRYYLDGVTAKVGEFDSTLMKNIPVVVNDNNDFDYPMCIYSTENLGKNPTSMALNVQFTTTNPALSPIFDADRLSAILINNMVDNPIETNTNVPELDNIVIANTGSKANFSGGIFEINVLNGGRNYTNATIEISEPDIKEGSVQATARAIIIGGKIASVEILESGVGYTDAPTVTIRGDGSEATAKAKLITNQIILPTEGLVKNIGIGKYLSIEGTHNNNGTMMIQNIRVVGEHTVLIVNKSFNVPEDASEAVITLRGLFTDEIAPLGGSVNSKYITKTISLSGLCNYLRIIFGASVPKEGAIDVYYKTFQNGGAYGYDDVVWTKVNPIKPIVTNDRGVADNFVDATYEVENIKDFDMVAVKVVFRSTMSSAIPKIKDLRIVACA